MRKIWFLCMALGLLGSASAAHADDWYAAFDYGYSSIGISGAGYHTPTNRGYRIAGGYDFGPHLSLEAGFMDFGQADVLICVDVGSTCYQNDAVLKAQAYTFDALIHEPVGYNISLFARLGLNRGQLQANYYPNTSNTADSTGADWGFGADCEILDNWKLRLQFAQYQNFGDSHTVGHGNVSLTSLGVSYTF